MYSYLSKMIRTQSKQVRIIPTYFLSVFLLIAATPNLSWAVSPSTRSSFKTYMGLDYIQRDLKMVQGYGQGIFNKRLPQGNVYLGLQLNEYCGIEAGYLFSQSSTRTALTINSSLLNGIPLDDNEWFITENKINLSGPHLSLVGYSQINASNFYLTGSVGLTVLKLKAELKPLMDYNHPTNDPNWTAAKTRHFNHQKVIAKLMGGVGYHLTESTAIRILVGYETTSSFKNLIPKEPSLVRISLKNNLLTSLGFSFYF